MAARTKARKRALDLLFEAEQRGVNAGDLLRERLAAPVTQAPLPELTADLVTGVVDRTFNAGAKIETANVDRRDFQYLYQDGDGYVFMDTSDYNQLTVSDVVVGDASNFMLENQSVTVALHDGEPLYVELPASVTLEITYTEPGLQGDRSTGGTKPATVETGYQIQVPLFLETGTKVKVDTRTGDYLGRVND